jgi:hypothetical protein
VAHYRLYGVSPEGNILGPANVVECDEDHEAIAQGQRLVNGAAVEIWEGARFVTRLSPKVSFHKPPAGGH